VGIYDRDYYRQQQRPGLSVRAPRTVVGIIIVINVAAWILDYLTGGRLDELMAVHVGTLTQPWLWWQYLTAGFAHAPNVDHILFNMLGLYILGPDVEEVYGRKEFLRLYLVMVVFASVVWNVANKLAGTPNEVMALGASGAIAGVVVLYALNFPHRTLLLMFVIPIPAWLFGVLMVGLDMWGASGHATTNIAYSMHLAGAAFAFVYHQRRWNLSRLTASRLPWPTFRRKPRLRVVKPDEGRQNTLSDEVDRILAKIYRDGEASLSAEERKTLETASREYQRRKTPHH
jgi:membrane associated rhomboid family serine protease